MFFPRLFLSSVISLSVFFIFISSYPHCYSGFSADRTWMNEQKLLSVKGSHSDALITCVQSSSCREQLLSPCHLHTFCHFCAMGSVLGEDSQRVVERISQKPTHKQSLQVREVAWFCGQEGKGVQNAKLHLQLFPTERLGNSELENENARLNWPVQSILWARKENPQTFCPQKAVMLVILGSHFLQSLYFTLQWPRARTCTSTY